jgi:hypothetical protein
MKFFPITILLSLFALSSCGSFESEKKSLLNNTEKKDLVNTFDISKDQADKYQAVETIDPKAVDKEKSGKREKAPIKKLTKKEKQQLKAEQKAKQKAEAKVNKAAKTNIASDTYPTDFPQLFKDYDVVSKPVWERFKPLFFQGEQSIIAISYLGVTAGYITMTSKDVVKMGDKTAFHYFARFKSKDAYRYFYWLDDTIESFIDRSTNLPIRYSLIQHEKKQNVDDLELFDFKKDKVSTWYKRVKEGANKDEHLDKFIPRYLQDSFSALQFVRGLPLEKGDRYDFPVSTRGETWLLKIEVVGEETISVNDKDIKAYPLKAETHFPGVLQKSGDINFWYAMDEGKRLVKFQAKVKLGSIYGELVEYKPGVLVK